MKRIFRGLLWAGAATLALLLLAFLLHEPVLRGAVGWLDVEDELLPADVLFLLNGDIQTRPFRVAQLYHQGFAPTVVIPRPPPLPAEAVGVLPNESELAAEILRRQGVPDSAIVLYPGLATGTWEEAAALAGYARAHRVTSVIVVTTTHHTRRARWAMRRHLGELGVRIRMAVADPIGYDRSNWWTTEDGLVDIVIELSKTFYYWVHY